MQRHLRWSPASTRSLAVTSPLHENTDLLQNFFRPALVLANDTFLKVRRPRLVSNSFAAGIESIRRTDNPIRMQATLEENEKLSEESLCTVNLEWLCMYWYPAKVIKAHWPFATVNLEENGWWTNTENTIFQQYAFLEDEERQSSTT